MQEWGTVYMQEWGTVCNEVGPRMGLLELVRARVFVCGVCASGSSHAWVSLSLFVLCTWATHGIA